MATNSKTQRSPAHKPPDSKPTNLKDALCKFVELNSELTVANLKKNNLDKLIEQRDDEYKRTAAKHAEFPSVPEMINQRRELDKRERQKIETERELVRSRLSEAAATVAAMMDGKEPQGKPQTTLQGNSQSHISDADLKARFDILERKMQDQIQDLKEELSKRTGWIRILEDENEDLKKRVDNTSNESLKLIAGLESRFNDQSRIVAQQTKTINQIEAAQNAQATWGAREPRNEPSNPSLAGIDQAKILEMQEMLRAQQEALGSLDMDILDRICEDHVKRPSVDKLMAEHSADIAALRDEITLMGNKAETSKNAADIAALRDEITLVGYKAEIAKNAADGYENAQAEIITFVGQELDSLKASRLDVESRISAIETSAPARIKIPSTAGEIIAHLQRVDGGTEAMQVFAEALSKFKKNEDGSVRGEVEGLKARVDELEALTQDGSARGEIAELKTRTDKLEVFAEDNNVRGEVDKLKTRAQALESWTQVNDFREEIAALKSRADALVDSRTQAVTFKPVLDSLANKVDTTVGQFKSEFDQRYQALDLQVSVLGDQYNNLETKTITDTILAELERYQPGEQARAQIRQHDTEIRALEKRVTLVEQSHHLGTSGRVNGTGHEEGPNKKRKVGHDVGEHALVNGTNH
jgi:hypothetical protein